MTNKCDICATSTKVFEFYKWHICEACIYKYLQEYTRRDHEQSA